MLLGNCKTYAIGKPLPQRTGSYINTRAQAIFGVAGGFAVHLAEVFNIIQRNIISRKVQKAVLQHTGMPGRKDKPIAVGPIGVFRVVV
jgi:hypothetical protein